MRRFWKGRCTVATETVRYKAVSRSVLGHGCCFAASVVVDDGSETDVVCECADVETAERIAAALSAQEAQNG